MVQTKRNSICFYIPVTAPSIRCAGDTLFELYR